MPIARFQMPDGRVARFEVPEGTTPEQAQEMIKAQIQPQQPVTPTKPAEQPGKETSILERAGQFAAGFNRILPGIASLPADTAANIQDLARAGIGWSAGALGRPDLAPSPINRANEVGTSEWTMKKLAQNKLDAPFVAPGENDTTSRMLQAYGSGVGGAMVTRNPSKAAAPAVAGSLAAQGVREVGGNEASAQMAALVAPAARVAIPAATTATGRIIATPFNARLSSEKRIGEAAGSDASKQKIAQALLSRQPSELGTPVTSREAVATANVESPDRFGGGIVRLQSEIARHPATTDAARTIEKQQEAGRAGALDQMRAGLADDVKTRSDKAAINYGISDKGLINTSADPEFRDLIKRPGIATAFKAAEESAKNRGTSIFTTDGQLTGEGAHAIKLAIDDAITPTPSSAMGRNEANSLTAAKNDYLTWVEKNIPDYQKSRQDYAQDSVPVNQKTIANELFNKLQGQKGQERLDTFLNATANAPSLIKKTGQQGRYKELGDVMSPEQMKVVNAIKKELRTDAEAERMASETDTLGALTRGVPTAPGLVDPKITILNKVLKSIGHDMDSKTAIEIQKTLESPSKTAEILSKPKSDTKRKVIEAVLRATAAQAPTINMQGEQ